MTSRPPPRDRDEKRRIAERFVDHLRYQPTDRPPCWETIGFWDATVARWRGEGLPAGVTGQDYFDMEALHWIPEIPITNIPFFPEFEEEVLSEEDSHRVVRNRYGITRQEYLRGESMPLFLSFPVSDRGGWQRIKHRLDADNPDRYAPLQRVAADFNARRGIPRGEEVCPFPVCAGYGTCRNLFGEERLAYVFYDAPELVHEIMATWLALYCGLAERAPLEFDFVYLWDDMAYRNGPLISPEMVAEFLAPYYRELIQHLRGLGYRLFLWDSDGAPQKILPLVAATGVNAFIPCEIAAGVDPIALQRQFGRSLGLSGGIDKRVLANGEREIYDEVMAKVPELLRHGGYVPAIDHTIPHDVPFDHYCYFVELVRRLGREISPEV